MKKCLIAMLLMLFVPVAKAETFTNNIGVEIDKEKLSTLTELMSEKDMQNLPQNTYDYLIQYEWENLKSNSVYVETTTFYNGNDNPLVSEKVISKAEYDSANIENNITNLSRNTSWETTYKKITISQMKSTSADVHITKTDLNWKKMPKVRSYDIIANRGSQNFVFESDVAYAQVYYTQNLSDYQKTLTADTNSGLYKRTNSGTSFLIKLPTDTSLTKFSVTMYSTARKTTSSTAYVYATYQHAASSVTLSQAQGHYFVSSNNDNSGLGNVLLFNDSSIRAKYDGMQGVSTTMYA